MRPDNWCLGDSARGDALPNPEIWRRFFESAPAGSFRTWVHCTVPQCCHAESLREGLLEYVVVPTTKSWHCVDTASPAAQALKYATAARVAPGGAVEKFLVVSATTLPIKPFSVVYDRLVATNDSDFCIFDRGWARAVSNGSAVMIPKHAEWVVLNRSVAEAFAQRWVPVAERTAQGLYPEDTADLIRSAPSALRHFIAPYLTSSLPSSAPRLERFELDFVGGCTGEFAAFLAAFGPISIPQFRRLRAASRCHTFVGFNSSVDQDPARPLDAPSLWAQLLADPHSTVIPQRGVHPAEILELGMASLRAMRTSPFLFARKFATNLTENRQALTSFLDVVLNT